MSPMCLIATPNVGAMLGAAEIRWCGIGIKPKIKPTIVLITIPTKIAPGTFKINRIEVATRPTIVSQFIGEVKLPKPTTVD